MRFAVLVLKVPEEVAPGEAMARSLGWDVALSFGENRRFRVDLLR